MATTMIRRPLSPRPTGVIEGYPRPGVIIERAVYILSRNKKTAICKCFIVLFNINIFIYLIVLIFNCVFVL